MKKATFKQYLLEFKNPSGTSRGILKTKETFFLEIFEGDKKGIGECALFRGLSYDDVPEYEEKLQWLCENVNEDVAILKQELLQFPSIWFGLEQAMLNLNQPENIYFPSEFTTGEKSIKINGLIWMGDSDFMQSQIQQKLVDGFDCIKLKIGVDWSSEKQILKNLRQKFPKNQLEIRVDANGGFSFEEAIIVLKELADLEIHSIEQPIKKSEVGIWKSGDCFVPRNDVKSIVPSNDERIDMAELCKNTPTPIALDEELIGVLKFEDKKALLEDIKPQYIILKPALVGGFSGTDEWISIAENLGIGWWITSALESNIGLNAIAQYTFIKNNKMPQGLGTGGLFTNNFESSLNLKSDQLSFNY